MSGDWSWEASDDARPLPRSQNPTSPSHSKHSKQADTIRPTPVSVGHSTGLDSAAASYFEGSGQSFLLGPNSSPHARAISRSNNQSAFQVIEAPMARLGAERIMELVSKEVFIDGTNRMGNEHMQRLREQLYPRETLGLCSGGTATDGYVPYRTGDGPQSPSFLADKQARQLASVDQIFSSKYGSPGPVASQPAATIASPPRGAMFRPKPPNSKYPSTATSRSGMPTYDEYLQSPKIQLSRQLDDVDWAVEAKHIYSVPGPLFINFINILVADESHSRRLATLEEASARKELAVSDSAWVVKRLNDLARRSAGKSVSELEVRLVTGRGPKDDGRWALAITAGSPITTVADLIEAEYEAASRDLEARARSSDLYLRDVKEGSLITKERDEGLRALYISLAYLNRSAAILLPDLWRLEEREWLSKIARPSVEAVNRAHLIASLDALMSTEARKREEIDGGDYFHWHVPFMDMFCDTFYSKLRIVHEENNRWKFMNLLQQVEADEVAARQQLVLEWMGCGPKCIHCHELCSKIRMKVERDIKAIQDAQVGAVVDTAWVGMVERHQAVVRSASPADSEDSTTDSNYSSGAMLSVSRTKSFHASVAAPAVGYLSIMGSAVDHEHSASDISAPSTIPTKHYPARDLSSHRSAVSLLVPASHLMPPKRSLLEEAEDEYRQFMAEGLRRPPPSQTGGVNVSTPKERSTNGMAVGELLSLLTPKNSTLSLLPNGLHTHKSPMLQAVALPRRRKGSPPPPGMATYNSFIVGGQHAVTTALHDGSPKDGSLPHSASSREPGAEDGPSAAMGAAKYAKDLYAFDDKARLHRLEMEEARIERHRADDTVPETLFIASDCTCRLSNYIDFYYTTEYIEKAYAEIKTFVDVALQVTSAWVASLRRRNHRRLELLNQVIAKLENAVMNSDSTEEATAVALEFLELPEDPTEAIYVGEWKGRRLMELEWENQRKEAFEHFQGRQRYLASNRFSYLSEKAMWELEDTMEVFQQQLSMLYWEGKARLEILTDEQNRYQHDLFQTQFATIELLHFEGQRRKSIRELEEGVYSNYIAFFHNTFKREGTVEAVLFQRWYQSLDASEYRFRLRVFKGEAVERAALLQPQATFISTFMAVLVAERAKEGLAWERLMFECEELGDRAGLATEEGRSRVLLNSMGPSGSAMMLVLANNSAITPATSDFMDDLASGASIRGAGSMLMSGGFSFRGGASSLRRASMQIAVMNPSAAAALLLEGSHRAGNKFLPPRARRLSVSASGAGTPTNDPLASTPMNAGEASPIEGLPRKLSTQVLSLKGRAAKTDDILRSVAADRRGSQQYMERRESRRLSLQGPLLPFNSAVKHGPPATGLTQESSFSVALLAMKRLEEQSQPPPPPQVDPSVKTFVAFAEGSGVLSPTSTTRNTPLQQSGSFHHTNPMASGSEPPLIGIGVGVGNRRPSMQEIALSAVLVSEEAPSIRFAARKSLAGLIDSAVVSAFDAERPRSSVRGIADSPAGAVRWKPKPPAERPSYAAVQQVLALETCAELRYNDLFSLELEDLEDIFL